MTEVLPDLSFEKGPQLGDADSANHSDSSPELPLFAALRCFDELLGTAIAQAHAVLGADPFRGLQITPDDVARWLGRAPGTPGIALPAVGPATPMSQAVTAALRDPGFHWLVETFSLTAFQAGVLVIVLAPDLDFKYQPLFAYLQDDVGKKRLSVDLILQPLCPTVERRTKARAEFGTGGKLIDNRLITVQHGSDILLLARPVQLDGQITPLLLGDNQLDSRLSGYCRMQLPEQRLDAIPMPDEWRKSISALTLAAYEVRRPLRLYLQGPAGSGRIHLAEAVAAHLGAVLLSADLAKAHHLAGDFGERVSLLFRKAWFKDTVLHLQGIDSLREGDGSAYADLLRGLGESAGVTLLSGQTLDRCTARSHLDHPTNIRHRGSGHVTRKPVRRAEPGRSGSERGDVSLLAERFRLTPAQSSDAMAAAVYQPRWPAAIEGRNIGGARPELRDLALSARDQGGQALATLARRIEPKRSWADVLLPEDSLTRLREICARVLCPRRILHDWGFDRRLRLGKGVTALFRGPSSTPEPWLSM